MGKVMYISTVNIFKMVTDIYRANITITVIITITYDVAHVWAFHSNNSS